MKNKTKIFYDFEATGVARSADPVSVGLVAVTYLNEHQHTVDLAAMFNRAENKLESVKSLFTEQVPIVDIKTFYAEFDDFNSDKADDWVKENIVGKLQQVIKEPVTDNSFFFKNNDPNNIFIQGNTNQISKELKEWLSQFEEIEFWADFDIIDKPMLVDLLADWTLQPYCELCLNPNENCNQRGDCEKGSHKIGLPKHLPNIKYYDFYDLHTLFKDRGIDPDISREEFAGDFEFEGEKHNALYDSFVNWKCFEKLNNK